MALRDYLRFEGANSAVLGVALVVAAAVFGDWSAAWIAVAVAAVGSALAWWLGRRTVAKAVREAVKRLVRPVLPDPLARIEVARRGLALEEQRRAAALQDRNAVAA